MYEARMIANEGIAAYMDGPSFEPPLPCHRFEVLDQEQGLPDYGAALKISPAFFSR